MPNTIPVWIPPVTSAQDLNAQDLISQSNKTVAGDATVIPVLYGDGQVGGQVFAVDYDDTVDPPVYTVGGVWGYGECQAIDAVFLNGEPAVAGVTRQDHLGTATQTVDSLLAAAITDYTDTLIITDHRGTIGLCYSVFQYSEDDYDFYPEFVCEFSGRKVLDTRLGGHVESRAWTLLSPSYESKTLDLSTQTSAPRGGTKSPDGKHVYYIDGTNNAIDQYDLKTPHDLATATYVGTLTLVGICGDPQSCAVSDDPTKIWVLDGASSDDVTEITMSTDWIVSTGTAGTVFSVSGQDTNPRGLCVAPTGLKFYVSGEANDSIYEYDFGSKNTLSGSAFVGSLNVLAYISAIRDIVIGNNGSTVLALDNGNDDITEITLSTAYTISTGSETRTFSVSSQETDPYGLAVDPAGTHAIVFGGSAGGDAWQYLIETAPNTWAFSETPALCERDFIATAMFGLGESVNAASVTAAANANEGVVIAEERRKIGLALTTRLRHETWRKALDTYAGVWSFKRGDEWVLALDRPRSADFVLTDSDFVKDSCQIVIADVGNVPTVVRVWYSDKTENVWRERFAEKKLDGVDTGEVEYRLSEVKLPGVGTYSQAYREAVERLKKLNRYLEFYGTLLDDHIGVEPGDVLTVTHKLGLASVDLRVLPIPSQEEKAGRLTFQGIQYSSADYDDTEPTASFDSTDRFSGSLGTSPITRLRGKANFSDFTTPSNGDIYIHGVSEGSVSVDTNGEIASEGAEVTVTKGVVRSSVASQEYYIGWDADEGLPFTIRNDADTADITVNMAPVRVDRQGVWRYDRNDGTETVFDITAASFDMVKAIGVLMTNATPAVETITIFAEATSLATIAHVLATDGAIIGTGGNVDDPNDDPVTEIRALNVYNGGANQIADPEFADADANAWVSIDGNFTRTLNGEFGDPCFESANGGGSSNDRIFSQTLSKDILTPIQYNDHFFVYSRFWHNDTGIATIAVYAYVQVYDEDLNLLRTLSQLMDSNVTASTWTSAFTAFTFDNASDQGAAFVRIGIRFFDSNLDETKSFRVERLFGHYLGFSDYFNVRLILDAAGANTNWTGIGASNLAGANNFGLYYGTTPQVQGERATFIFNDTLGPIRIVPATSDGLMLGAMLESVSVGQYIGFFPKSLVGGTYNKDGTGAGDAVGYSMGAEPDGDFIFTNQAGTSFTWEMGSDNTGSAAQMMELTQSDGLVLEDSLFLRAGSSSAKADRSAYGQWWSRLTTPVDLPMFTDDSGIDWQLLHGTIKTLSGTTPQINAAEGTYFVLSTTGNTTFTFVNAPPTGVAAYRCVLELTAGGTHTITYPASVRWPGNVQPTDPASGETDLLEFFTRDGGTTWHGRQISDDSS